MNLNKKCGHTLCRYKPLWAQRFVTNQTSNSQVQMFLPGTANVMSLLRTIQLAFAMVRLVELLFILNGSQQHIVSKLPQENTCQKGRIGRYVHSNKMLGKEFPEHVDRIFVDTESVHDLNPILMDIPWCPPRHAKLAAPGDTKHLLIPALLLPSLCCVPTVSGLQGRWLG